MAICGRCKENRRLTHHVSSDLLNADVCESCAAAARGLPLKVEPIDDDPAAAVRELFFAWVDWRAHHDLKSEKLKCCAKSDRLFKALEGFESFIAGEPWTMKSR